MSTPALRATGLSKSVGADEQQAGRLLFSGLDLEAQGGEILAITGESGVGKSTLLNLLAGLDRPDAGSVAVGGVDLSGLDERALTALRRTRIGFVFQAFHILPYLSLEQNVALPLALAGAPRAEALARAREQLAAVGLGTRGADGPERMSGGELQRVAIARALAHRPQLILADEPTGNLDPGTAGRVLDLFAAEVRRGRAAAVIVTHSATVAAAADRVLELTPEGLRGG